MNSRRALLEERLRREQSELLCRHLTALREAQRGAPLPPAPSALDRALYAEASPAEIERADALLRAAGLTHADLARADLALAPVDETTRGRARTLRRVVK